MSIAAATHRAIHNVIKDHNSESKLDHQTLAFMEGFGNAQYGVALPYNYKSHREWETLFGRTHLQEARKITDIGLYPFPVNLLFDRGLHFVSLLTKKSSWFDRAFSLLNLE